MILTSAEISLMILQNQKYTRQNIFVQFSAGETWSPDIHRQCQILDFTGRQKNASDIKKAPSMEGKGSGRIQSVITAGEGL